MGSTVHGIKFPELPDIPNVPADIGGTGKLDQTVQAWLSQLDATNISNLAAQNTACAVAEANVSSATTAASAAVTRQAGQQSLITTITGSNDGIGARLDARDMTLAADASTVQGYAGQITGLQSLKARGLLGVAHLQSTTISGSGSWQPFAHVTFNDPATPNGNRQYRAMLQAVVFDTSGITGLSYNVNVNLFYTAGATFSATQTLGNCLAALDTYTVTSSMAWIDAVFTSVTDSQWTIWAAAAQLGPGLQFAAGELGDFMTVEDVGLSI